VFICKRRTSYETYDMLTTYWPCKKNFFNTWTLHIEFFFGRLIFYLFKGSSKIGGWVYGGADTPPCICWQVKWKERV
jgi:hypothetical protein